jgi:serine/threonine-protein kinase HipA
MTADKCLQCYQPLEKGEVDFHKNCSLKFFGTLEPPKLDYSLDQMKELAAQNVLQRISITGVQPKMSLNIEKNSGDPRLSRLTIVGLWGHYILKPPSEIFPHLPENEDLTMNLAALFGIETAEHSLIRLKTGELAYITKRFDRVNGQKLPLEDMCQLTETLTSQKYRGSMEKVGRHIDRFSSNPGIDKLTLFTLSLFSYISGNADMHLKNFSLLTTETGRIRLAPAYDLLSTKLAMPEDKEDMALTLNAKKNNFRKKDFEAFAAYLDIPSVARDRIFAQFSKKFGSAEALIEISCLSENHKTAYRNLLASNYNSVEIEIK